MSEKIKVGYYIKKILADKLREYHKTTGIPQGRVIEDGIIMYFDSIREHIKEAKC